ncbi:DUF6676 family protein [uncultured Corynebacterium sp.]|uniref:Rv1476 family membrane protein n=1 Tax=uncultured Corynebacterium sp. TaxID=159447 RepID=UPI0028F088B4|nr:DUF6676 family protein [uncultured Corynebacterium sp.]
MVPESVNLSDLSEQLLVDGVALERDNDALHRDLVAARDYAASRGVGELGIAVLEVPPARLADMRDIAQELARDTGIATMVVKVPGTAAVVSTKYSRADLEKAQQSLVVQPDYGVGVRGFADSLANPLPVGLLSVLLLVVVAAAVGASLIRIKAST